MPAPTDGLKAGGGNSSNAPFNPRLGDHYREESSGPVLAREIFLSGCGLPAAWAGQAQWRVLETSFGQGLSFLVTWAAWKADPVRPTLLHFVAIDAFPPCAEDVMRCTADDAGLHPLALQLHAQLWGLLPGFHRLVFEGGHVLLTLCIGDTPTMLRQQAFEADSVYLDGCSRSNNAGAWDTHTLKALARRCRRGTRMAAQTGAIGVCDTLSQCGFVVQKPQGTAPEHGYFEGQYNPAWEPKQPAHTQRLPGALLPRRTPSTAVVVGAGLAGAAVANSLARRGWRVMVLDAAAAPASGASGLPAGLLVPHVSVDDGVLSRLSRSGVRMALQQAGALLEPGVDWHHTGVLAHDLKAAPDAARALPQPPTSAAFEWRCTATTAQLAGAGLAATANALWHAQAGWIKPARLVNAWLGAPGIAWRGNARAAALLPGPHGWQVMDAAGAVLAQADLVVLAAACGSQALAATVNPAPMALQAVRGQVSWGLHKAACQDGRINKGKNKGKGLPDFPVNGHGGLLPAVPGPEGMQWLMGASYERGCDAPVAKQQDHDQNLARLRRLLPQAADLLANQFNAGTVQAWAGVRCTTPGRLPTLGCMATTGSGAAVWVCSGMGSRGLTFAFLCAELLAAQLHGEPLPVEKRLAEALMGDATVAVHA